MSRASFRQGPSLAFADGQRRRQSCLERLGEYGLAVDQVILEREAMRLHPKDRALVTNALLESLDDEAASCADSSGTEIGVHWPAAASRL